MNILPEGEQLRRAINWLSEQRLDKPAASLAPLIDEACLKFDLPPNDAEFLLRHFTENG